LENDKKGNDMKKPYAILRDGFPAPYLRFATLQEAQKYYEKNKKSLYSACDYDVRICKMDE
jgi:hypothetical protein